MTWFRLDDSFHSHPKVLAAGNDAVGLWVRCCTYSAQHLLNGKVPDHIAMLYGTPELAQTLTDAGLWRPVAGGYIVRDFLRYNPSKKQVEKERKESAMRQRKAREAKKARMAKQAADQQKQAEPVTEVSRRDNAVSHGVSHGPVTAPRPDPTRPELPTEVLPVSHLGLGGAGGGAQKRARRLPDDWQPGDNAVAWAREHGFTDAWARAETEKFCDYYRAHGKAMKDWTAAWRNWLRKADEQRQRWGPGASPKPSTTDQRVAAVLALREG